MTTRLLGDPVLRVSMRQIAGPWWIAAILGLSALPVLIGGITAGVGNRGDDGFVASVVSGLLAAVVLPLVTMALGTAAFGNDLEDRTLGYLVLRPVGRLRIVAPKFAVIVLMAAPLLAASGAVSTLIGLGDGRAAAAVAVGVAAGAVAYASVFMWIGLITTRAKGFALLYVFLWEGLLATFFNGIGYLSIRAYSLSIMHGIDPQGLGALEGNAIGLPAAVTGMAVVAAVFFLLTVRRLRHMDVP